MGIFRCTERGKTAFLRLFRSIFLGQNVGGSASQVSPEEERSGGQAVPVCFRLVKKLSGCLFDFSGRRVRRLLGIEVASRGEWTILEGMGLTF